MVSKRSGGPSSSPSGNKPGGRSKRKPKKPVTIDLEATKGPSRNTSAKPAEKMTESKPAKKSVPKVSPIASTSKDREKKVRPTDKIVQDKGQDKARPAPNTSKIAADRKSAGNPDANQVGQAKSGQAKSGQAQPEKAAPGEGGMVGKIGAGIAGGAIALAGAWILQSGGILPAKSGFDAQPEIAALKAQIKALESSQNPTSVLAPVEDRIAKIEAADRAMTETAVALGKTQAEAINELSDIKSTLTTLGEAVAGLKKSVSEGGAGENAGLAELTSRVNALNDQFAGIKPSKDNSPEIADLAGRIASIESSLGEKISASDTKLVEVENQLAKIAALTDEVTSRIASLEESANAPSEDEKRVAQTLAITGLKSAIDSGGEFSEALGLYESLVGASDQTASLKEFAKGGIPTRASIEKSFGAVRDAIIRASAPKKQSGVVGKFFDNARSLVKVKTIGAMEGDSVEAVVSRMEVAVKSADFGTVLKEWETLSEPGKEASKDWIKSARARYEADTLIGGMLKKFMAGVAGN